MANDIEQFDFSVDLLKAILWQYTNADNLIALLEQKSAWYDANQTSFWQNWISDVFDLRTANDFGLSVWSIILNQPIFVLNGPPSPSKATWGFGSYRKNFNRGNFTYAHGNTYRLPTQIARILLQLRYFQLISSGTVPETNRMLKYVFSNYGSVYLLDGLNMTQEYVFNFPISSDLSLMLNNFDVLPRPAGVKSTYLSGAIARWGFGVYHINYNRGNFGA